MLYKRASLTIALLVLTVIGCAKGTSFEEWVARNNKKYTSTQEFERRRQIYLSNTKLVKKLNHDSKNARFALNAFADLSPEELREKYLRPVSRQQRDDLFRRGPVERPVWTAEADLPTAFDWVEHGAVSSVKDQKSCGSCWAFGATGNMEGQWFLHKTDRKTPIVSLSPQNLVDCDHECMYFPSTKEVECDEGCDGGMEPNAFQWAIKNEGIMSYEDYPYKGAAGQCLYKKTMAAAKFSNWTFITCDEDALMEQLYKRGPLSIGVYADTWFFYSSGVYTYSCGLENDHAVLLTGWGVTEDGVKYWIIKNSWGTSWGKEGYIWLERGVNKCGLLEMISTIIV